MQLTPLKALSLLRQALTQEIGITFTIDPKEAERARLMFYKVRQGTNEPELDDLQICCAQSSTEIMILRKPAELD